MLSFYKKKMDDLGVEPGDIKGIEDITKLPFTTKEDLRNNYPFGLLAVPKEKITRVQGTSGTTGKLTLASYTNKDVEVWGECVARGLTMAGLTAEDRLHICYGYGLFTGGLGLDFGARALGAMAIPMSSGNTKRQLMCMEDFGATAFACTPSYAMYLAEAAQEMGVIDRLQVKTSINGAEHGQMRCVSRSKTSLILIPLISMDYVRLQVPEWLWIVFITRDCMYTKIILSGSTESGRPYTMCRWGDRRLYLPRCQKKVCHYFVTELKI